MSMTPTSNTPGDSGLVPSHVPGDEPGLPADAAGSGVLTYPLFAVDPPKIGDFWPAARLAATQSGVAYLAYEDNATAPVMVILLSQGAADDPAARDRFAGQVDRMDIDTVIARGGLEQDQGPLGSKFRSESDDPQGVDSFVQAPWVALGFDNSPRAVEEAARVLRAVDLDQLPPQGAPAGPDYRLHWSDRIAPGLTRVWPLPWPGRRDRGGRLTILASWLLMLLLAAIALLIVILIFSRAPQTPPPPPIPPTATATSSQSQSPPPSQSPSESPTQSQSESPSESPTQTSSPSPSESSASPSSSSSPTQTPTSSPTSASPTPSTTGSPSQSPTPTSTSSGQPGSPTASGSPGGAPSSPSRL